ncbi:MAG: hypothetical protein ABSD42_04445 [Candidatus Bathyarchaeia archaeon]
MTTTTYYVLSAKTGSNQYANQLVSQALAIVVDNSTHLVTSVTETTLPASWPVWDASFT